MNFLYQPWPWYLAGFVIGITVPTLLFMGNKRLGISSTLRHICAACVPSTNIPLLNYDWKKETWSLFFAGGILLGGFIGGYILANPEPVAIAENTRQHLASMDVDVNTNALLPEDLFNWQSLFTLKGFLLIIVGGFLVGFGTRYAGGCTSGHGIMGLASMQWTSLLATSSFFIGGIVFSKFVLPFVLAL